MRSEGVECEGVVRGWWGGGAVTGGGEGVEGGGEQRLSPTLVLASALSGVAGEDDCSRSNVFT